MITTAPLPDSGNIVLGRPCPIAVTLPSPLADGATATLVLGDDVLSVPLVADDARTSLTVTLTVAQVAQVATVSHVPFQVTTGSGDSLVALVVGHLSRVTKWDGKKPVTVAITVGATEAALALSSANAAAVAQAAAEAAAAAAAGASDAGVAALVGSGPLTSASLSSTYAAGVSLPDANGTNDTTAIQAVLTANPGKRIYGKPGASYKIGAPLVIASGTTLDMTGCTITLLAGSNCRMLQNAALLGAGARDTDIHIRGGYWDRGANAGVGFNLFGICLHRADRASVKDARFHATAGKYACYAVDVTEFTAERLEFTTESDGLHVTGPASRITIRDITGTTGDDLVSITGRDYTTYELTDGGGDVTGVLIENLTHRGGDGNTVKILPGAAKVMSNVTIRRVTGNPDLQAVSLYSDTNQASTTGGTLRNITVEDVSGAPLTGIWVMVNHPDVQGLKVSGLMLDKADGIRGVAFSGGGTVTDASIDGVTTIANYGGSVVHVGTGSTVTNLRVSNVTGRTCGLGIVYVSGTIGTLQLSDVAHTGTQGVVMRSATGVVGAIKTRNIASASEHANRLDTPSLGLYLSGAASNYVATPDSAALSIVGDIDMRCRVTLADWTPAADNALITKHAAGKTWNWFVSSSTGLVGLLLSTDGTNWLPAYSSDALGIADGSTRWLRVTVDVNDGAGNHVVRFYTSFDGVGWTPAGVRTVAGVIALADTADQVELGGRSSGGASNLIGAIHYAEVRNGLAGTVVAAWDGSVPAIRQRDDYGNLWTVAGTANGWRTI